MRVFTLPMAALTLMASIANSADASWPSLPKTGFVSGRAATQDDVKAKNAGFVVQVGDTVIGKPLPITIPQYAYYLRANDGKRIPVIIIQAEEARDRKFVAARLPDGTDVVGFLSDFELLGTTPK